MTDPAAAWRDVLIRTTLQAAVPLRIADLGHLTIADRGHLVRQIDTLKLHADDDMFGGRHTAEGVRNLISGLALLAYAEGGVTFAGMHWCTDHAHCIETGWKAA